MTCREASNLLPLLFDGELAPHQMRAVALHSAGCPACEAELRDLERVQRLVRDTITAAVDTLDFSSFWPDVERRLEAAPTTPWARVRTWWAGAGRWTLRVPAYAAVAAVVALALVLATRLAPKPGPQPGVQIAAMGSAAWIDSVDADGRAVLLLEDGESDTALLWVGDSFPGEAE